MSEEAQFGYEGEPDYGADGDVYIQVTVRRRIGGQWVTDEAASQRLIDFVTDLDGQWVVYRKAPG